MDIATAKHGLVTTSVQASYVGATGSGLLLGMGLLGRSYGFTIDNLHAIGTTYLGVKQIILLYTECQSSFIPVSYWLRTNHMIVEKFYCLPGNVAKRWTLLLFTGK